VREQRARTTHRHRPVLVGIIVLAGLFGSAQAQDAAAPPALDAQAARIEGLERRVVELLDELTRVRADRDRLQRLLDRLVAQDAQLEADRLLLTELRKDLPDTRAEAEAYLQRLRRLASVSDPARLAPLAARMTTTGSTFLDWRHDEFATSDARSRAFAESGAHGFPTAFANFRNAVLLTVSNRLDGLLILIE
jgi:TolA-binding protein